MSNSDAAPRTCVLEADTRALAVDADGSWIIGIVPEDATVSAVSYTTVSAITGANTDTRTVAVVNKGASGVGSTAVASLALVAGVSTTAFDEKALTLSGTAANLLVTAGHVLAFTSTHAGDGLADVGGKVRVTLVRR